MEILVKRKRYYDLKEAASLLNITTATIRSYIKNEKIKSVMLLQQKWIKESEIARLLQSARRVRTPLERKKLYMLRIRRAVRMPGKGKVNVSTDKSGS